MKDKIYKFTDNVGKLFIGLTSLIGSMVLVFSIFGKNEDGNNPIVYAIESSINKNGLFCTLVFYMMLCWIVYIWTKTIYDEK